ncbi:MAG: 50S ribosomal protein L17 [Candidatus Omnitrophota bacterium]
MRHHKGNRKLGMMTSHRKAFLRNMARNIIKFERIETTSRRAKEARRLVERLITLSKTDSVFSRRRAYDVLSDRDLVMKLFKDIAPLFASRNSGFTRIIPIGFRRGDGAQMVILELTERKIIEKLPKKKKAKAKAGEAPEVKGKGKAEGAATEAAPKEEKKEVKKEEPKIKAIPKSKPTLEEEKHREKAKSEDKKAASHPNFMKNLRGLFRKRGDR